MSISDLQNLQARPCVQLDQQGASLLPDWSQLLGQNNRGQRPHKTGHVEWGGHSIHIGFQPAAWRGMHAAGLLPSRFQGWARERKTAGQCSGIRKTRRWKSRRNPATFHRQSPAVVPPRVAGSGRAATSAGLAPAKPRDLDSAKSGTIAAAKPAPVSPAKSDASLIRDARGPAGRTAPESRTECAQDFSRDRGGDAGEESLARIPARSEGRARARNSRPERHYLDHGRSFQRRRGERAALASSGGDKRGQAVAIQAFFVQWRARRG